MLSVLPAIIENIFRFQHGNIRRMRHDPIKFAPGGWRIEVALAHGDIFEFVQSAVEFREMDTPGGNIESVRLFGAISRRQESGDSGSAAQFEKALAWRSRNHRQKTACRTEHGGINHV